MLRVLFVLALAWCGSAFGQSWNTLSPGIGSQVGAREVHFTSLPTVNTSSDLQKLLQGRTYTPGLTGSVSVGGAFGVPGPMSGVAVPLGVTRSVPWGAIAKGLGRAVPLVGTALAIKDLMDGLRCRESFAVALGGECDDGVPQIEVQGFCTLGLFNGVNLCGSYASIALQATAVYQAATPCTGGGGSACSFAFATPSGVFAGSCFTGNSSCPSPSVSLIQTVPSMMLRCPDNTVRRGFDGRCATDFYSPKTPDQVATKAEEHAPKGNAVEYVKAMDQGMIPLTHPEPLYSPPAVIQGDRLTTVKPDGSTEVRDVDYPTTPTPIGYKWEDRVRLTVYPPGVTPTPPGQVPAGGATTTTTGNAPAPTVEVLTCGLPGKPPCKIDETGTPAWDPLPSPVDDVNVSTWKTCMLSPSTCVPALPSLSWSFTLPTGCTPITLSAFSDLNLGAIDVCQFQPTIHDLMSILWAAAGLFGAVRIMSKDSAGGG